VRFLPAILVVFWVAFLLHEAGHYGTAALLRVSIDGSGASRWSHFAAVAAGPAVTLALALLCVVAVTKVKHGVWLAAAVALASSAVWRFVLVAPATFFRNGVNDEATLGRILGVSPRLIWLCEAMLGAAAWYLVFRAVPIPQRRKVLGLLLVGMVVGTVTVVVLGRALGLPV
jgi:hypothetical protein